ncbi:serine hydrolase domain-containing protein [uncultured Croceitalea sp.]|uniref:serine hydrolase domain-containing protein n=1 Tax=uncultured Croceitalea sp. TaxID=1798908 RepID=UPI0033063922
MISYIKKLFSFKSQIKSYEDLNGVELADAIFNNLIVEKRVPSLSVTILHKGQAVLQKGYGYADLEKGLKIKPKDTVYRIASVSKCITGLAFGKMVEDGIVGFDDSFYKYVPDYPKKKYDFTLRQLAGHSAGIRGYRGKEFALNQPFTIKDSTTVFKNDPLVFEPNKGYLYNSFDFVLLSLAMQVACGVPFEDYVQNQVLEPLGLQNTYVPDSETFENSVQFYTKTATLFKTAIDVNNYYKLAGGGYLSTSTDIAKFGQAVLGQKLLQPETYDELLTAQTIKERSTYYGLGFQVSQDNMGNHFVGHVGNSVGAYTNFFVYPDSQLVISILINCTDPKVQTELDMAITALNNLYDS